MERQVVFSFRHVQLIVRHKQAEVAEARAVVVRRERIRAANLTARCAVIVVVVLQEVASLIFEISDAFSLTSSHSVNRKLHVDEHSLLAVLPLVVVDPHILHIAREAAGAGVLGDVDAHFLRARRDFHIVRTAAA